MERQRSIIISFVLLFTIVILSFLTVNSFEQTTAEKELVADPVGGNFSVTYYANGGLGQPFTEIIVVGDSFTTHDGSQFAKTGYKVNKWNTQMDGKGESYPVSILVENYEGANLSLYAEWVACSYLLTYDANDGTGRTFTCTVKYDSYYTFGNSTLFEREGYTISGWYLNTVFVGISYVPSLTETYKIVGDKILYAKWQENAVVTLSYDVNGGNGSIMTQEITCGTDYTMSDGSLFEKVGYVLLNWNTQSDGQGISYELSQTIQPFTNESDLTLYAIWVPNTYHVLFNYHEATDNASDSGKTVTYDALYGTLPSPMKIDNTFQGWYTLADGGTEITSETIVQITEEQTIHAHWSIILPDEYILTITAIPRLGGTVTQGRMCSAGTVVELTATPALGYEFVSWSDGGLQTHNITVDGNISVTAVFKTVAEDMRTLSLSSLEGGQAIGSGTYTEGSVVSISAVPDPGYEFVSWSDGGLQTHTVILNDDIILTVQFEKIIAEEKKSLTQRIAESESDVHLTIFNSKMESDSDAVVDNAILLPEVVDGRTIMLSVRDDNNKKLYSWTFNCEAARYNEQSEYSKLDIRVRGSFAAGEIFSEDKVKIVLDKISARGIPEKSLYLDFQASGPLPYRAVIDYLVGIEHADEEFAVYYYNEMEDTLEDTGQNCVVSADGYVTLALDHCSYYVLLSEIADAGVDDSRPYILPIILMITAITVIGAILLYRKGSV